MNLLKSLTNEEKRKIREAVIPELERYRFLKLVENPTVEEEMFCRKVEMAIERLSSIEKFLITERYTNQDSEYITDYQFYNNYMNPPVSHVTYSKIRNNAMYKIALFLEIDTGVSIQV